MSRGSGAMTRRDFVKGAAGAAGVAVVAGAGGVVAWDRASLPVDPSAQWDTTTGVDRVVLAATLAPSSHNTQPWRFRVDSGGVDLIGDTDRLMGKADPRLRELHVSLGCALENAVIAAAAEGRSVVVEQVKRSTAGHHARLRFVAGEPAAGVRAELAAAIPARRTNRGPYDADRVVAPKALATLGALASPGVRVAWLDTRRARGRFSDLSVEATRVHLADVAMQRDSHRWYRMARADAERHRDGITVSGANLPAVITLMMGLFPPTPDSFDEGWAKATRETHCGTAPAFGLLIVGEAGDHRAWVEAGRTFQRIALAAAREGMATHPISQALALRDREVAGGSPGRFSAGLAELSGAGEVALAFRIGYPVREQPPSMRRAAVIEEA